MQKTVDQQVFRKMLARNVSLPLFLSVLSGVLFVWVIFVLLETNQLADHSTQAIGKAYHVEKLLIDSETGVRGFVISGQDSFLEPYKRAQQKLPEELSSLKDFVKDNPGQAAKIASIEDARLRWQNFAEGILQTRRAAGGGKAQATNSVSEGAGKEIMDGIRSTITEFINTEDLLRQKRNDNSNTTTKVTLGIIVALSLIFGVIIAFFGRRQLMNLSDTYEGSLKVQMDQNFRLEEQQWLDIGRSEVSQRMLGDMNVADLGAAVLKYLCEYLGAQVGLLYVANEDGVFENQANYAIADIGKAKQIRFKMGESLLGQAASSNKLLKLQEVPADYVKIKTGLGDKRPHHVVVVPFKSDGDVNVVMELGFYAPLPRRGEELLADVSANVSTAITSAIYREKLARLYSDLQNQAEELQAQQEELRVSNEELEEQTKLLRETQTRLEAQHAELEQTNTQLEEQTEELEKQREVLSHQNEELLQVREGLEEKAGELSRVSQYKSEFLANMSHELRTPLNSSMILAKLLADNKEKNLTPKQIEFAQQIVSSGNDLLNLINDILDLSKVESGKLDIHPEKFKISDIVNSLRNTFNPLAMERKLDLVMNQSEDSPENIFTDRLRLEQILKNLLSNAIKFTHQGQVALSVRRIGVDRVLFTVADTGIGIAKEQQEVIFEAFRQADGTDSRKYSGTGLGLAISRDLAHLLGGEISVTSEAGKGSQFGLNLPVSYVHAIQATAEISPSIPPLETVARSKQGPSIVPQKNNAEKKKVLEPNMFADDRKEIKDKDRVVLIVEDDEKFAKILYELAHESEFKAIVTGTADDAIDLASAYSLQAVLLDMHLPDHSGLYVLDSLKRNPATRHIPVHVISGYDFSQQALHMGALGYMLKPVKREELKSAFKKIEDKLQQGIKRVLIVEDDQVQREAIARLVEDKQIEVVTVGLAREGLDRLKNESFDSLIMDLTLPDMSGFEFLDKLSIDENSSHPPVIVYTGRDLSRDEEERLRRHSQSLIIKGAGSPDRLLNEVTLFLHNVESKLQPDRQKMLDALRSREKTFDKRNIMIVDDDIRNVFALTAALEQKGAHIIIARDGKEALDKLNEKPRVDMVLMDIMMPVMNGYDAMKEIRKQERFKKLPIIALTAKAMKDDRDLCLNAGANDYLAKPVDMDKLISLMRIWMSNTDGKGAV
ncbi:MAG: response regulator [Bdellovibrionales bacterium]|nr:response regulator [Bdellovibrionales bacterium]